MSSLTSASTDAQVWAAYDDAASYEEDGSRAKALAFTTAARILLRRRPASATFGSRTFTFDERLIREELQAAQDWLDRNPATTAGRVRYADLSEFRG